MLKPPSEQLNLIGFTLIGVMGVEYRLAPPRHPQKNGMAERFNGRISELLQQTRFDRRTNLETALLNYVKLYNHHTPQRAIGAKMPIQALIR